MKMRMRMRMKGDSMILGGNHSHSDSHTHSGVAKNNRMRRTMRMKMRMRMKGDSMILGGNHSHSDSHTHSKDLHHLKAAPWILHRLWDYFMIHIGGPDTRKMKDENIAIAVFSFYRYTSSQGCALDSVYL